MRRGVGVNYVLRTQENDESMKAVGTTLEADKMQRLAECCKILRTKLAEYARKHRSEIARTPELREQFQEMCNRLGVDLLASQRSLLSETLGLGDFYFELAVQVIEQCIASRNHNGGLFPMEKLVRRLCLTRPQQRITAKDVTFCLQKLTVLGPGYVVRTIGGCSYVMYDGVDDLVNTDGALILSVAQSQAEPVLTVEDIMMTNKWDKARAECAMESLLKCGVAWVEINAKVNRYWFPSLLM